MKRKSSRWRRPDAIVGMMCGCRDCPPCRSGERRDVRLCDASALVGRDPSARMLGGGTLLVRALNEDVADFSTLVRCTDRALFEQRVAASNLRFVLTHPRLQRSELVGPGGLAEEVVAESVKRSDPPRDRMC